VRRNRELLCSVFLLLAGTTQGRRRVCFFTVWFGFWLRERQREEENRFMGLLLNFFSPSHGLSLCRSDSLCLSARERVKGRTGKKENREERRRNERVTAGWKRNIEDGEFLLLLFFFFFLQKNLKGRRGYVRRVNGKLHLHFYTHGRLRSIGQGLIHG
jgi:hypothetical protein